MQLQRLLICAAVSLSALCAAAAGSAAATEYTLNLTAPPPSLVLRDNSDPGFETDYYAVLLTGLNTTNSILVSQGDKITENITFSSPVTAPPILIAHYSDFEIALNNMEGNDPFQTYGVSWASTLYDAGIEIDMFSGRSVHHGHIESRGGVISPTTFDSIVDTFTVTNLSTPVTLDETSFNEFITYAVPEPSTWALMLLGFGGMGAALRSAGRKPPRRMMPTRAANASTS